MNLKFKLFKMKVPQKFKQLMKNVNMILILYINKKLFFNKKLVEK